MRMFVLGATGHLGQAVVRHALAQGHSVTAASRQLDPAALRGLKVRTVRLDDGLSTLTEISAGHNVLVDAAAPYPLEPCLRDSVLWRQVVSGAVEHAERVLEAARRNRLRIAFISSCTTLALKEPPLRAMERAWRRSAYPYFEAKAAMEQAVMRAAAQGLPAVIVNPGACLGPWEFRAENSSFVGLVLARRLSLVMNNTLNVIDVRDVAEAIARALAREFFGRPIALAGNNVNLVELARQIVQLDGAGGATPRALDPRLASLVAFWTSVSLTAINRAPPDPWRATPLVADGFPMKPSPEQLAMGLTLHSLTDTLRDAIAFHRTLREARV